MRKTIFMLMAFSAVFFVACNQKKDGKNSNPFFSEYNTPFQVPPFDKIDSTHYLPAFEEAMKQHDAEIQNIINSKEEPTFENTILAYDKAGLMLTNVSNVFFNVAQANTNEQLQAIERKISPKLSKHNDDISMNENLFKRVKVVYDKRNQMKLDDQQIRVVEKYYRDFVRLGANLPKDKQDTLKKINSDLATLGLKFGENLLSENKEFKMVVDNIKDLDGLPQASIDAAAEAAKEKKMDGKWVFTIDKPCMIPFLQYTKNRALREKLYRGYFMKCDNNDKNDNKAIVTKITNLRVKKAQLLGYKSYAAYVIDDNMAKTPEKVDEFLMKLWNAALPMAKEEVKEMQKIIDKEGGKFKLQPWDWWYYSEKVRKEKYDLDESELKPYFKLENVRDGMFFVANKMYGLSFTKLTNLPVYQKDVETFEVKEADGKHLGIIYFDYFPRESKRSGAWCTSFQNAGWRDGKKVDAIVSIVYNVTKPTKDTPSLLTWDEVETLFHEFGHGLHGLFTDGKYNRTAGVVPQDYVEMPSQFMENYASEPQVLKIIGKHYKTGEVIPDALIQKIQNSGKFNQGFITIEYLAASILDMDYHNLTTPDFKNVNEFEKAAMDKIGLIPEILPRYRTDYFSHIWDGGYAAGYYVYIWAAVLDADAFSAFKETGDIYNKDLAAKFRKFCLQDVGGGEGMDQYRKFRGKDPSIEPLLNKRGLN
ncbi:MAG: M3 family metallopeptidase [Bacteroidota bacterium]